MFLLKDVKLYHVLCPQGIPFDGFGFYNLHGHPCIENDEFMLRIDANQDAFLLPNGEVLPISCATLYDVQGKEIPYETFSIIRDKGLIQINRRTKDRRGYHCVMANINEVFIDGESYDPNEDL